MKKLILLAFICFGFGLSYAQEIQMEQLSLITKRTATWCPNCGTYGWELFEYALEDNTDKAIIVAAHYGGSDIQTNTSSAFASNFPGGGQPKFFVNNESIPLTSGTVDAARASIKDKVDNNYTMSPQAAFGLSITEDAGVYSISGKLQFLEEMEGDFQLGVYQVEKTVIAFQSQQGANAEHKQVLTIPFTDGLIGEPLTMGTVSADTEFDFSYSLDNPADAENIEIIAILWSLESDETYTYINGIKKDLTDTETTTGTTDPNTAKKYGKLQVSESGITLINAQRQNIQLDIVDLQGRIIHTFVSNELDAGEFTWQMPYHLQDQSGLFVVRAIWNGQFVRTRKLVQMK
ncbi:MAG: hypothetical protein GYB31_06795 [Bacteroidetes bacterium]|nr:hypothetical protein [Bacteroidota bacterium]